MFQEQAEAMRRYLHCDSQQLVAIQSVYDAGVSIDLMVLAYQISWMMAGLFDAINQHSSPMCGVKWAE